MKFTEYSLLMAVLWSNVIILLIYFLRRQLWFVRMFNIKSVSLLYAGCLIRLFANIELDIVHEISLPQLNFLGRFLASVITLDSASVPILNLLLIIWISGSLLLLFRIILLYKRSPPVGGIPYSHLQAERMLSSIIQEKHRSNISVIVLSEINSPCVVGILSGKILLPNRKWGRKKLQIILMHEYAHFKNHDLLVVLLVNIFTALFWWNPPVYLLKSHVSEILEFKADEYVLKNCSPSEARYYCRTLIEFAGENNSIARCFALSALEQRISRILEEKPTTLGQSILHVIMLCFAIATLALSYYIILQPYFTPSIGNLWSVRYIA